MKRFLTALVLTSVFLSVGCTTVHDHTQAVISSVPPVIPPKPDPVTPAPVQWKVYNATELKALSDQLKTSGTNTTLFTLDTDGFKNLSNNLVDIKRYIEQQNAIIDLLTKAVNAPADAVAAATPDSKKK